MSLNLGIIPPVLEMSVVIASTVIRGLLAIPYSWFLVSQSQFPSGGTLGQEDLAQKIEGKELMKLMRHIGHAQRRTVAPGNGREQGLLYFLLIV